jgi:hypothetical protein
VCPEFTAGLDQATAAAGRIAFVIPCSGSCEDPRTGLSLPGKNRHMTSTLCQSPALDRIIAPWAAKLSVLFAIILETIVAIAGNVRNTLRELGTSCRKAGRRLPALCSGLSRPMTPKPKIMGRHAALLRHGQGFLAPSASALHVHARKRSPEVERAAEPRRA